MHQSATGPGPLYIRLARLMESQIARGVLKPGERLPSIRAVSGRQNVSISTALQAYLWLENEGRIEARPRSGFYVRPPRRSAPPEPAEASSDLEPREPGLPGLISEIIRQQREPVQIAFGAAIPSPDAIPCQRIAKILARTARRYAERISQTEMPPGYEPLRRQIARMSPEFGCDLSPANIVVTCGAMESVNLALRAATPPSSVVAVETPAYYGVLQMLSSLGHRIIEIPTHPRQGMDLGALDAAVERHGVRSVVVMANCHNPLGYVLPEEWKRDLAALAARRGIAVIEDDIYGGLVYGDGGRSTVKGFDREGNVLYCSSFSKTAGPGYRIGWIEPGRHRAAVERLQFTSTVAPATLQQIALADFLATGGMERYLRKARGVYESLTRRFSEAVAEYFPPGTRLTRPAGGFLLWIQLPDGRRAMDLYTQARERGISIIPGDAFSPANRFRDYLRINCGHPWSARMDEAVRTLGQIASQLPLA